MTEITQYIIHEVSYPALFLLVSCYFLGLYFGVGGLFLNTCRLFEKWGWLSKITDIEVPKAQVNREIKHSLTSIFIFGFSGIPIVYLIRMGAIQLMPDSLWNIAIGLVILTLWNEVHFFIIHRIMHLPYFMKTVHTIHHQSVVPTVYAVFSFHWLEAFLLSTVPLPLPLWIPFAPSVFFLFPLVSILINFAGHCNYRFGDGQGPSWWLFGTAHHGHHHRFTANYGFLTNILDRIYSFIEYQKRKQ